MGAFMNIIRAFLGICETKPLDETLWQFENNTISIQLSRVPQLAAVGGAVYLRGKGLKRPILVVRTGEDELRAYENRCTHAGRKIDPVPGQKILRCCSVCHSRFDLEGNKVSGPAKRSLKLYNITRNNDVLMIDLI